MLIKVGSRKSNLALIQANLVISRIEQAFPDIKCEIVPVVTSGDKILDKNLYEVGGKALFLKELEEDLLDGKIDIAVHSLKDVPGILPSELKIAAVLEREDARDALISEQYKTIDDIPLHSKVGTSSPRRRAILKNLRPDLEIVQFRGNIDSRLMKITNNDNSISATILAMSGLVRSGLFNPNYCHPISQNDMLPAAGQGIIGIQTKENDKTMLEVCAKINHLPTWHLALAERSFLEYLDASCKTPIAAYANYDETGRLFAKYMLADLEGQNVVYQSDSSTASEAQDMGYRAGAYLSSLFK